MKIEYVTPSTTKVTYHNLPSEFVATPPPAHQDPLTIRSTDRLPSQYRPIGGGGYREGNGGVKEEPVLDMSGWNPGRVPPHYTSYRGTSNLHAHCPPQVPSPLNLDANEAMKAERKRARNRVAASKCRMRKMEKIATLDHQASILKKVNCFRDIKCIICMYLYLILKFRNFDLTAWVVFTGK